MTITDERIAEIAREAVLGAIKDLTDQSELTEALWDDLDDGTEDEISAQIVADSPRLKAAINQIAATYCGVDPDAITWRDYSVEQYGDGPYAVAALCRSHDVCEEHLPNADGHYLTLGEAVDWAQKHVAEHAEWAAADADYELRAALGSAYDNLTSDQAKAMAAGLAQPGAVVAPREATQAEIAAALNGSPLLDGVVYPLLSVDQAMDLLNRYPQPEEATA